MPRHKAEWFGPRLKELREAAGVTQAELGKRAGIVGSQINKLELSVNQPTLATAVALAKALGIDVNAFVVEGAVPASDPAAATRPRKAAAAQTAAKPAKAKKPKK